MNYLCFGRKAPPSSLCDGLIVFPKFVFICLLAPLGLCCCAGFSLIADSGGHSLAAVLRRLTPVSSLIAERRL